MKAVNLTKLLRKHTSGWVAVSGDYRRVIASAKNFIDLQKKVKNMQNVVVVQAFGNYYNFVS